MLNKWDVLAIIIIGLFMYIIANKIIMGLCAKKAIEKCKDLGCDKDELFDMINKKINDGIELAIKAVNEEFEETITKIKMVDIPIKTNKEINQDVIITPLSKKSVKQVHTSNAYDVKVIKKPGRPRKKSNENK